MRRRRAAYVRVSTQSQDVALQREAIERASAARGLPVDEWFSDEAARDKYDRPALTQLRAEARRGKIDLVWVWKLDRLGSGALGLLTVVRDFRDGGAQVCSVCESFDTSGPAGAAMLALIGCFAESELESIRARTAEARARAERNGKTWGRPAAGTEAQRRELFDQLEKGLTLRSAAKHAGLSYGSAQRIKAGGGQAR